MDFRLSVFVIKSTFYVLGDIHEVAALYATTDLKLSPMAMDYDCKAFCVFLSVVSSSSFWLSGSWILKNPSLE